MREHVGVPLIIKVGVHVKKLSCHRVADWHSVKLGISDVAGLVVFHLKTDHLGEVLYVVAVFSVAACSFLELNCEVLHDVLLMS